MRPLSPRYVARALAAVLLGGSLALLTGTTPTEARPTQVRTWVVAPGVTYREWHFTAGGRPQRVHVLDVDPHVPGVSLDYRTHELLRQRTGTHRIVVSDRQAVAGTNGSFFDIGDTGAPLGIGLGRVRGALHGPTTGWETTFHEAFYQDAAGRYRVGALRLLARITRHPAWPVAGVDLAHAQPDAITVYTPDWGPASGRHVVDRRRTPVREVRVVDGVVRGNSPVLSQGRRIRGLLLVGLGRGAQLLASLPVGTHVDARWWVATHPRMAITGDQLLLRHGQVVARAEDPSMSQRAPRTAVGLDHATGHVLLVTLDGRQPGARGLSVVAWARFLARLGLDEAVNLDGGASSTMVARTALGTSYPVVNRPSLGHQRPVPDALVVEYAAQP